MRRLAVRGIVLPFREHAKPVDHRSQEQRIREPSKPPSKIKRTPASIAGASGISNAEIWKPRTHCGVALDTLGSMDRSHVWLLAGVQTRSRRDPARSLFPRLPKDYTFVPSRLVVDPTRPTALAQFNQST